MPRPHTETAEVVNSLGDPLQVTAACNFTILLCGCDGDGDDDDVDDDDDDDYHNDDDNP